MDETASAAPVEAPEAAQAPAETAPEEEVGEVVDDAQAAAEAADEAPETGEAPADEAPSPLDALAEMELDEPVEGMEPMPLDKLLATLPVQARATIKALQADYTRKTQAIAEERRRLEAALAEQQRILEAVANALPGLEEQASKAPRTEDGAIDLYDPDGLRGQIAEALKAVLSPVQEDIKALLAEREDLRLEDAYFIARGKRAAEMRRAQAEQVRQVATRRTSTTKRPKFRNMHEAYEWARSQGGSQ